MYFKETGDEVNVPAGVLCLVCILGIMVSGIAGCRDAVQRHRERAEAKKVVPATITTVTNQAVTVQSELTRE